MERNPLIDSAFRGTAIDDNGNVWCIGILFCVLLSGTPTDIWYF